MGRLVAVSREVVRVATPGPPGPQGPPGSAATGAIRPEDFAVDPDDLSDFYYPNDSAYAIQAAINAAAADGGWVQLTSGKTYGCSGDILQKNGVAVRGAGANAYGNGSETRIKAVDDTFRYKWGDAVAGGANFPAELENVIIDGDNIAGDGHEVLRCEAVDSTMVNVQVLNSAGDGVVFFNAQNCLINNLRADNCPTGSALKIQNNDEILTNGQGAGHLVFVGGHLTRSYRLLHVDYEDNAGSGVLGFWPHDNMFFGTIFEQYQDSVDLLIRLSDGETRFHGCTITGSSGITSSVSDCIVLVENQKRPTLPTYATFDTCDFGGGAVGVSHLVRSNSFGVTNAIRIYGKTTVANANKGYFLCDDRAGGGLGVLGGAFGPVDGLIVDDSKLAILGAGAATNTFTVTSGFSDLSVGQKVHVVDVETGTYLAQLRTITALPTGPDRVTLDGGALTLTAGDYLQRIGVKMSTGINGGLGGAFKTILRQPLALELDADQGNALQVKRKGDAFNRWQTDRDGTQRYIDPTTGATIGAIIRSGALFGTTGRFGVGGSFYRSPAVSVLSVDGAVSINWEATSSHVIAFTVNGADATSISLTSTTVGATPADGQEILIWISGTGTNVITWTGSGITFDGTAPQPVSGLVQFVEIVYRAGVGWFEKNRSHRPAGATGDVTGPGSSTSGDIVTFSGTTGKVIQDSGKALPSGTVVGTTDTQTLTNKTLTAPAISSPTGLGKGDVGLGNVDNTSNATERAAVATLTNKRITQRVSATTSTATLTPDIDSFDKFKVTAQAAGLTIAAPTGTPTSMQGMVIRIKDNGTARSITWNATYRAIGVTLPTTTVISKTLYVGFMWNSDDSKWDAIAVAQEA